MAVTKRGNGFQTAFMVGGVRYRAQFDTVKEAELWEDEVRLAIKKGLEPPGPNGSASTTQAGKYATLGACFDYTTQHVWADKKAAHDLIRNGQRVVNHFGRDTPVKSIGRVQIDEYVLTLKNARNSGGTINRKLAALSRILRTAVELGALQSKPMMTRQRESEGRERYLERNEVDAIVSTLRTWSKPDHADLVEFLVATGCRISEALSLDWRDVQGGYIKVVGDKSKTSKTRLVPISDKVGKMLSMRLPENPKGPFQAVTYHSFRPSFDRALGHLGLDQDDVVIHTLRHTTASWLALEGVDIYRIMKFMGHSNIKTTMRYAKLSPNALGGLADVIGGHHQVAA